MCACVCVCVCARARVCVCVCVCVEYVRVVVTVTSMKNNSTMRDKLFSVLTSKYLQEICFLSQLEINIHKHIHTHAKYL